MSKQGRWQEMAGLITDEVLHTIAACGTPEQIAEHIREAGGRHLRHGLPVSARADRHRGSGRIVDELSPSALIPELRYPKCSGGVREV